ncbi:MAG: peroxiredoxin, partial [Proteobacteria bacterium]|nr:peroxiredoxin [Pseudomonadota bacterium]
IGTLGIVVISDRHMNHLLGLTRAVKARGGQSMIFLTHKGVLLTQDPRFKSLAGLADISLCKVSFQTQLPGRVAEVPGLPEQAFTSQAKHGELIDRCDRYLVL